MTNQTFLYENANGDRVEATSHEFVTRLKGQGFKKVNESQPENVEVTQVTPEFDHDVEQEEDTEPKKRPRGNPMDPRDKKLPN